MDAITADAGPDKTRWVQKNSESDQTGPCEKKPLGQGVGDQESQKSVT